MSEGKPIELRPKTAGGQPCKSEYVCDLCGRSYGVKSKLMKHMASKTPCYQRRDLAWMKAQIESNRMSDLMDMFEQLEQAISVAIVSLTKDSTTEELDDIRRALSRLKRKKEQVLAHARIISGTSPLNNEVVEELNNIDDRIEELVKKYKLLLIL